MILLRSHRNYVHRKMLCKVRNFLTNFRSANLNIPASCMDTLWVHQARRSCSPLPPPSWRVAHSKNYCLLYKQTLGTKTNLTNTHWSRLHRTSSSPFIALNRIQRTESWCPTSPYSPVSLKVPWLVKSELNIYMLQSVSPFMTQRTS